MEKFLIGIAIGMVFILWVFGNEITVGEKVVNRIDGNISESIQECERNLPRAMDCKIVVINPVEQFKKQIEHNNPATRWMMERV